MTKTNIKALQEVPLSSHHIKKQTDSKCEEQDSTSRHQICWHLFDFLSSQTMSKYTSTIFKLPVSRYFIFTIGRDRDNGSVLQDMNFYFQNVCNN